MTSMMPAIRVGPPLPLVSPPRESEDDDSPPDDKLPLSPNESTSL